MSFLSPKVWTLCVAWVCCASVFGQNEAEQGPEKHWSQFMKGNVTDIQQADEAFRNQNDTRIESRSCGEKPFNRWSWWMSERGGWTSAPKASSWWTASETWRSARTQTSSVSMSSTASASQPWQYVGPEGVPTHGGAGRINRLKVDPMDANHWYACAPSGGLWQTYDSGANWEVVGVDILSPLGATDLWIDPQDAQHLWLATGDGNGGDTYSIGLLESWDHGQSWVPLELSFESSMERKIQCIGPHPTSAGSFLVATDLGVFKTSNGGDSFDLVLPGQARDLVWLNDTVAVAAIDNNGIHRSSIQESHGTRSFFLNPRALVEFNWPQKHGGRQCATPSTRWPATTSGRAFGILAKHGCRPHMDSRGHLRFWPESPGLHHHRCRQRRPSVLGFVHRGGPRGC